MRKMTLEQQKIVLELLDALTENKELVSIYNTCESIIIEIKGDQIEVFDDCDIVYICDYDNKNKRIAEDVTLETCLEIINRYKT